MDDTVQGGPKRSARKVTGRQGRLDAPGGQTIAAVARHDASQAVWDDGDRILTRQTRQDEKGGPQSILVVQLAAEHPSRAGLDRLAHEYGLRDELDSAWAAKPLGFIKDGGRSVVLEDCAGPARQLVRERTYGMVTDVAAFLRLPSVSPLSARSDAVHSQGHCRRHPGEKQTGRFGHGWRGVAPLRRERPNSQVVPAPWHIWRPSKPGA